VNEFGWFDLAWPWIGLGFAAVLLVLLFATKVLRSDTATPRWRDLRWLSFLAVAAYLVHQVEEYGITADGVRHAFPDALCATIGLAPYPDCAIPPAFYLAVNIVLVWIAAPVAGLLSRRFPLAGMALWGVIAVNALVHIAPAIATQRYDPGLLTAAVIFVPLTVLAGVALIGRSGPYRVPAAIVLLAAGVFMHAVLGGGLGLFLAGVIPAWLLVAAQPAGIAVGYIAVGAADRRLRRSPATPLRSSAPGTRAP